MCLLGTLCSVPPTALACEKHVERELQVPDTSHASVTVESGIPCNGKIPFPLGKSRTGEKCGGCFLQILVKCGELKLFSHSYQPKGRKINW